MSLLTQADLAPRQYPDAGRPIVVMRSGRRLANKCGVLGFYAQIHQAGHTRAFSIENIATVELSLCSETNRCRER